MTDTTNSATSDDADRHSLAARKRRLALARWRDDDAAWKAARYKEFAELNGMSLTKRRHPVRLMGPAELRPPCPRDTWAVSFDPVKDWLHKGCSTRLFDHPHYFSWRGTRRAAMLLVEPYGDNADIPEMNKYLARFGLKASKPPGGPGWSVHYPGWTILIAIACASHDVVWLAGPLERAAPPPH